ncbi:MAG: radical SAM family heme chaperone HemW [Pseudomonadota bacterium]|nr:radical SAM family heme chaperone HemW [Pseudomonadota bacterium]MEC8664342.1 radical SAM family heme chaperone HemW [Pseudomonadota bacterium]
MFGIYIHWPFCASKCPYCDFNSHVRQRIDQHVWADAYAREIEHYAALTKGKIVTSVFFGGGTPSLMEPDTAASVIAAIRKHWPMANDCEITLEANPTSIEADKFAGFRGAGIDRVSVGVQALNDADLKFLGRQHNKDQALRALDIARNTFDRYSFDLIYARPNQTPQAWETELREAMNYAGGHLSLYQLTIEKGTPFYTQYSRGDFSIPTNDEGGELYEITQRVLEDHGLPAYEISNHASEGQQSRHNLTYWRYYDYVGIGPGAHGRLTIDGKKVGTRGHRAPEIWLDKVAKDGHGSHPYEAIDTDQRFAEMLMMGLRLREGIKLSRFAEETGQSLETYTPQTKLQSMIDEGYITVTDTTITATQDGRQRLNGLLDYLLN